MDDVFEIGDISLCGYLSEDAALYFVIKDLTLTGYSSLVDSVSSSNKRRFFYKNIEETKDCHAGDLKAFKVVK